MELSQNSESPLTISDQVLTAQDLQRMDAYWRRATIFVQE